MKRWVRRLETREWLLIAFFAALIVATRVAMRWHLHLPGHSMLPAAFALVLVRCCVAHRTASTICGTLAGLVVAALGMGRGGPLIVFKLMLPGIVIDLAASGRNVSGTLSIPKAAGIGALAGASTFVPLVVIESLAGVAPEVIVVHAVISTLGKSVFGAAGGAAAAWVAQELRHHGFLDPEIAESGAVPSSNA